MPGGTVSSHANVGKQRITRTAIIHSQCTVAAQIGQTQKPRGEEAILGPGACGHREILNGSEGESDVDVAGDLDLPGQDWKLGSSEGRLGGVGQTIIEVGPELG